MVVGAGQNFLGLGGHNVFLRSGAGQLLSQEFGSDASLIQAIGLTYQGRPWTVDISTTTIGTGQSFWGGGGHDVFLRSGSGQLLAQEFGSDGSAINARGLTYQGRPWIVDAGATAIGSGQNFWVGGGHDVFLRTGSGQLLAQEFGRDGSAIDARGLTYQGRPWIVDAGATAIGTGQSFWGGGGHDVFLRSGSGQLLAQEFGSDGSAINARGLTYQGSALTVSAGTMVVGVGQNLLRQGGHDAILQLTSGQRIVWEINNNGVLVAQG